MIGQPRQVLFVSLAGWMGGAEHSLVLLVQQLAKRYRLSVVCPSGGELSARLGELGVRCYKFLPSAGVCALSGGWMKKGWRLMVNLLRVVFEVQPDIIHANNFHAVVFSIVPAMVGRCKLIWHGRDFVRVAMWARVCSWFCHKIIAVSQAVQETLVGQGVDDDKIVTIYNGVDSTDIKGGLPRPTETAGNNGRVTFTNIGQFVPWKQQTMFLRACVLVIKKWPGARFLLVGDDLLGRDQHYKKQIFAMIEQLGMVGRVDVRSWQVQMEDIWRETDCLVHTARHEPFGRVLIEAMARRIPVIAVAGGGPSEIIRHGQTGMLIRPNDEQSLARYMVKLAGDMKRRNQIAAAGQAQVARQFLASKCAAEVADVYESVMAGCET